MSPAPTSEFKFVKRHRIITTDDYWGEIDEYQRGGDQLLLSHIRVARWSPSVRKSLLHDWGLFRQCVTAPLFATGLVDDDKFAKFLDMLGYKLLLPEVTCVNGGSRRLYIHQLT